MKKEDFNIYEFHHKIKTICSEITEIELQQQQELLQFQLNDKQEQYNIELQIRKELQEIQYKLNQLQEYQTYIIQAIHIVSEFNTLLNCTVKNSFMKKPKANLDEHVVKRKVELISMYLSHINNYSILSSMLPTFENNSAYKMCKDCNVELDVYENNLICPDCCCEYPNLQPEDVSYKDLSRINTNVKYSYIRQTHFKDTIKQFQGRQQKYIDKSVYQTLYKCFDTAGFPKNNANKYFTVSKDHIKMFLQESGLYKYYEDMNLIYYMVTGVPCPNIEQYEKQLIDDFDKLIVVYDKVIKEDSSNYERSNFLNSYYVLYQLLKKNGYACKESDFPIIKTVDRKIEHDEIYEKCCKQLGWFFFPIV
jgi:hypothetical protein